MKHIFEKGTLCYRCGISKVDYKNDWVPCIDKYYNHSWNKENMEVEVQIINLTP